MNPQGMIRRATIGRTTALLGVALLVALGLAAIAIASSTGGQSQKPETRAEVERALIGTWRLTSFPITDQNGDVVGSLYGDDPVAKLTYTPQGDVVGVRRLASQDGPEPRSAELVHGDAQSARPSARGCPPGPVVLAFPVRGPGPGPPLQPARQSPRAQLSGGRHHDRPRALRPGSVGAAPTSSSPIHRLGAIRSPWPSAPSAGGPAAV